MATNKRATNIRLSTADDALLDALTRDTGLSQTAVIVLALRDLAKSRGIVVNPVPQSPDDCMDQLIETLLEVRDKGRADLLTQEEMDRMMKRAEELISDVINC